MLDAGELPALQTRRFIDTVLAEHGLDRHRFAHRIRLWRAAPWSVSAFALGVILGFLIFSDGLRVRNPNTRPAVEPRADLDPIARNSFGDETEDPEEPLRAPSRHLPASMPPDGGSQRLSYSSPARASTPGRARFGAAKTAPSTARRAPLYRGSLVVYSYPPGARVSVDGRMVGFTPLALKDVHAGSRLVRVEAHGYERWSAAARVVANRQTRVTARLNRGSEP